MEQKFEKTRAGFYLKNSLLERCDRCWKACGFASRSDFVSQAIEQFIAKQERKAAAEDKALVENLTGAIEEVCEKSNKQLAKGMFRYAVNIEMLAILLAQAIRFTPDDVGRLRKQAIKNVQRTKGVVRLSEVADYDNEFKPLPPPERSEDDDAYEALFRDED